MSYDREKIWRCTCGTGHFLTISAVEDEGYLHLEGNFQAPNLLARLKGVAQILWRGHFESWMEILLDRQTALEVRDELDTYIKETP